MSFPAVCVVVLNWNGAKDTIECLQSLSRLNYPVATIVLVDNSSTDFPRERFLSWAKSIFPPKSVLCYEGREKNLPVSEIPSFVFIQNQNNLGFAGGNNSGIRYAMTAGKYDFIWILNNDTVVSADALKKLVDYSELKADVGILGSTIVYHTQRDTVQCAGGCRYNPWTTTFYPLWANQPLGSVLHTQNSSKIDYVYGAAMFVRASVFKKCGLLNGAYFLFFEEIDFCKKAQNAGYELAWCRDSIVWHKVSQSIGNSLSGNRERIAFANYHENLSTLIYSKKNHPFIFPFSMIFRFFGKIAVLLKRGEPHLIKPMVHAYVDFFRGRNLKDKYQIEK